MKSYTALFDAICSWENLLAAAYAARRGKRGKADVIRFELNREHELIRLRAELLDGSYAPGAYRRFTLHDRKPRVISAAPYRDRVVHHALCRVIEPLFERAFIFDSYACRKGKGQHRAVDRYQHFARQYRCVLQCDVRRYFPSIDHEVLEERLFRVVRCPRTRSLIRLLIATGAEPGEAGGHSHGIPIGNLTSQFFANVTLDPLDHLVKDGLGCLAYVRYCDDFVLLHDDKRVLHAWAGAIRERLAEMRLRLKPGSGQILPAASGCTFLGYRVFPDHRRLRADNPRAFGRRLRAMARAHAAGEVKLPQVGASVRAWVAHAEHADTFRLREAVFDRVSFRCGVRPCREGMGW